MTPVLPKVEAVARALYDRVVAVNARHDGLPPPPYEHDKAGFYLEIARAAINAHETALADAGLVIVPREPTEAMITAGYTAAITEFYRAPREADLDAVRRRLGEVSYRAMVKDTLMAESGGN